ncbi:hypothetical protein [Brevibacillus sp. HB2.2]|uniref:hypothetical protein n=1 Tax=Brevibacillus sp. HB2.2 TaxID=2738846 RepID=UPI00156AD6F8|nr:hypothetical protein [Brevibacillus sp. HB2.2]NRS52130.1 hypothetical protein [Brevibacillus sp. HB2.2]
MNINVLAAKDRIRQIDWSIKSENKKSNAYLVAEYLMRASQFLIFNSSTVSNLFFSPIKILNSDTEIDLEKLSEEVFPDTSIPLNPYSKIICLRFIEMSMLIDSENQTAIRFKDIYEPIIKFIERGGRLRIDQGVYLEVGGFTFLLGEWVERHSKFVERDISDANLNYMDSIEE